MGNVWTKFAYDDGAEIFYKISKEEENVTFMKKIDELGSEEVTLYFDEIEEVMNKINKLR